MRLLSADKATSADPKGGTIAALTGVRAYAAVWVMLLHLEFGIGIKDHVAWGAVIHHGFWAVDVFFVLSGFILSMLYASHFESGWTLRRYWPYLVARFARIYPLHLCALGALALYYLPKCLLLGFEQLPPGFTLRGLLTSATLLHAWGYIGRLTWNYPSWSISSEWFAYLLMLPLLARGLRATPIVLVWVLAAAAWALLYKVAHGYGGELIGERTYDGSILRIAVEFTLGYALFRLWTRWRPDAQLADLLSLGGLAGIIALTLLPDRYEWLLAPAVCGLLFGLTRPGPMGRLLFENRYAVFWGERSYSIYMLHAVVQIWCNLALLHFGAEHLPAAAAWALLVAEAGMVLLASNCAYGWIEVPMRRHVRTLLEGGLPALQRNRVGEAAQERTL